MYSFRDSGAPATNYNALSCILKHYDVNILSAIAVALLYWHYKQANLVLYETTLPISLQEAILFQISYVYHLENI